LNLTSQCIMRVNGSDKKIYIVSDDATGFFEYSSVDILMCTEKCYLKNKHKLGPVLKEGGQLIFI